MRSYFKILVVSSLESFPTYAILMASLVPANNRESLTIRQSLSENESEWLNSLAETAVILLLNSLFYFELASETKRKLT